MISLTSRHVGAVWEQLADELERLITCGAFLPGENLPSPEELAWQMVVNPNAVRDAYERLIEHGAIERIEQESAAVYRVAERREERD